MPLSMQVKLLRVIQEKEVLPVGAETPVPVDVRFIAATHRDLKEDVEQGIFRQDLFYRLNVITIKLPSLTMRDGDIPLLAYHFLAMKSEAMHKHVQDISREAMDLLCKYSWPGNIRELENIIERAVALAKGKEITPDILPEYLSSFSIQTYRHNDSELPTLVEQRLFPYIFPAHLVKQVSINFLIALQVPAFIHCGYLYPAFTKSGCTSTRHLPCIIAVVT
jgi:DNA-binding NtrC family response regulator